MERWLSKNTESLVGKKVAVTGTTGGIGKELCKYLAKLGAELILCRFCCVNLYFLMAALIVFFGAIPFVNKAMRDTGTEDPGWIVIDEVCGIFMALTFVKSGAIVAYPWILAIAFVLFRFFDILKPLGIHRFEKFPGAWGVMADDLLGGFYAGILMVPINIAINLFSV